MQPEEGTKFPLSTGTYSTNTNNRQALPDHPWKEALANTPLGDAELGSQNTKLRGQLV